MNSQLQPVEFGTINNMANVDFEELQSQLTLEEKISLLVGASTWRTVEIPRLGIPNLKVSDGPSGARGEIFGDGVPANFLPSGVSLGATWDIDLLFEVGQFLAEECKTKSASVSLAPTMCIHRHPLGGRNFESFSEDPILTGRLATAHVRGLQSRGIAATPKHFVANDQETNRFHVNAIIPNRTLREVYLLPFQMVVRDADPWCIMTAYNKVNGYHCDMSNDLLTNIARNEWTWDGVFMSDWGGTNSCAASINAGFDLEMPGPPIHRTEAKILKQIEQGEVDMKQIDSSTRRILELLKKTGRFEDYSNDPEFCDESPSKRQTLLKAACEGIVLLKNEGSSLPLKPIENLKKLAIFGPNSKKVVAGGGGSAYIKAPYWTCVYDSVKSRFDGTLTEFHYAVGAEANRYVSTMPSSVARNPDTGVGGAAIDWYLGHDFTSPVVANTHVNDLYYVSFGNTPLQVSRETEFSFRLRTTLTPKTTGVHRLSFASIGPAKMYIDGELVVEEPGHFEERGTLFFTYGSNETIFERPLDSGRDYQITIDYLSHDRQLRPEIFELMDPMMDKFQGVRIGYHEYDDRNLSTEAADLAQCCDAAIVVVGRDKEWETEGHDIPVFDLPGEQVQLIENVAASCKRTIVVVQAGTPVNMLPWIDKVHAVIYAWYQGQELGNAAAAVICGEFNPSGRLPITFPRRLEDCPAFSSFPGEDGTIYYSEGLYVGYKWWDLHKTEPLFPIGFGLSYCQFVLTDGRVSGNLLLRDTVLSVTARVKNIGGGILLPGRQTVIAWCSQTSKRRLARPVKQICGFTKTPPLHPGEDCQINITIDPYSLAMWDPRKRLWILDQGSQFDIRLGTDASNATSIGIVEVPHEIAYIHRLDSRDMNLVRVD
ncbi:hypothetical protein PISL3812_09367 [Talaromyces islandicus]|uniref:beta-glucosidase n=1 Tax=Talaromyces islandicus TaxID=28573 RepID=A0A0U1MBD1_TALIS|nr:hypothetical protein PISL3812_09367 [Talaromyces islandicus]